LEIFLLSAIFFGIICALIANNKKRNSLLWLIFGSIFGIFALIILLVLPSYKYDETPTPETHFRCPDCAELILKQARKCKHCGCLIE
jgi:hypothetical protein